MTSTADDKKYCPLWRVMINGEQFELRARTLEGALMSAIRRDTQVRMAAAGVRVDAHTMQGEARAEYDWHDAVITCERIGEPEQKRIASTSSVCAHCLGKQRHYQDDVFRCPSRGWCNKCGLIDAGHNPCRCQ